MKKYLIIAFLFLSTLSFAQTGIGWGPIRYKVNFRDTINIDVSWMVHDTTILTSAKAINYLQGATSNVQTQISNKQDIPVNYAPTVITFGNATQNYDITGTTWVAATAGIPDAVGHLLPAALTSIATAYDGEYLAIREAAGVASATNPLTVQFTFPAVATFNVIKFRSIYVGSASHDMVFELYNGATWDIFTVNSIESAYVVHSAEVLVPATYIIGGTVLGRFRHEQTGNTGHHLDIDFIVIASGGGSGGAHTQSAIQTPSTATGDVSATNVQAAIEELESEKLAIADTATMLGHYIERTDTTSLSARIDLKLNKADSSAVAAPDKFATGNMLEDGLALKVSALNASLTGTTNINELQVGDATSNTIAGQDSISKFPSLGTNILVPFINGDTAQYHVRFDMREEALALKDSSATAGPKKYATGKMLADGLALKANAANAALTGTPTSPTAALGTNTTQIATTAFVQANNGTDFSKLQFIIDTTDYGPVTGDSIVTHSSFVSKHIEVYRGNAGDSLHKQYRNPSGALQIYHNGYRFNSQTGQIIFKPVFATNEHIAIEVTDSISWTTLSVPFYADYQTIYNAMDTVPVGDTAYWQDDMVYSLDSIGYWDRIKLLYVGATRSKAGAKINWKTPGTYDLTDPGTTNPAFTKYQGFTGGTDDYLSSNYNVKTDTGTITGVDHISLGAWTLGELQANQVPAGCRDGGFTSLNIYPRNASGNYNVDINNGLATDAHASSVGFSLGTRRANNDVESYRDGVTHATISTESAALPDATLFVGAYSANGTAANFYSGKVPIVVLMDEVTDGESLALYNIFHRYMTRIGQ